ncbi:MAG: OsmC family protein [Gammaproteobacteria bacterium]|nr:OsmC family protein [Gammaproteobacteria bacterium]
MVEINVEYQGELHCVAIHVPSQKKLETDAPKDNQGKGETFSPTDLIATALGTCVATIMGLYAKRHALDLKGLQVSVKKTMSEDLPRRIASLEVDVLLPKGISPKERIELEKVAHTCPVHKSLHPDIKVPMVFRSS